MGFKIGNLPMLDLGYQGENKARTIEIDMTAWLEEFPGAKVGMMVRRPGEATLYPADLKHDGNIIRWGIKSGDVAIAGEGEAQIILTNEEGVQLRSRVVKTKITVSLSGTEVEAPPPQTNWVGEVLQAADKAEDAVGHMPVIGENGNWFAWNADKTSYEDTGNPSQGETGKDGKAATVQVGTVTTLPAGSSATVTNSGTETEAVLNFGIPRGEAGTGGGGGTSGNITPAMIGAAPANHASEGSKYGMATADLFGHVKAAWIDKLLFLGREADGQDPDLFYDSEGNLIGDGVDAEEHLRGIVPSMWLMTVYSTVANMELEDLNTQLLSMGKALNQLKIHVKELDDEIAALKGV